MKHPKIKTFTLSRRDLLKAGACGAVFLATEKLRAGGLIPFGFYAPRPDKFFVFAAASGDGYVSGFRMNANNPTLARTATARISSDTSAYSVAVDPTGQFVYVVGNTSGLVYAYTMDPNSGALAAIGTVAAGTNPRSLTIDPTGRYLYVGNYGSANVSMYTINTSTGALAALGTPTIAAGTNPIDITVDATGRYVYVANQGSNTLSQYSINVGQEP